MAPKAFNSKSLTAELRKLITQAHGWSEADGVITKGEALAQLIWQNALGYTEVLVDDEGNKKEIVHPYSQACIQLLFDRVEGKAGPVAVDNEGRVTAATKVSELARTRVNAMAAEATGDADSAE